MKTNVTNYDKKKCKSKATERERERERVYLPQNTKKNIENHSKLTIVAGYQIGKPIKLFA